MHYEGHKHTNACAISPRINKASGRPFQELDDGITATILVSTVRPSGIIPLFLSRRSSRAQDRSRAVSK